MDINDNPEDPPSDPDYLYRNGPGHPAATPETLAIMWRMMSEAGIKSFRPDFNQPMDSPDNQHLLDLAVKTFIELVNCQEYTGVASEVLNKETIRNAIFLHITQRLRRRLVILECFSFQFLYYVSLDIDKKMNGKTVSEKSITKIFGGQPDWSA